MVSPCEIARPRNKEIFTRPPEVVTLGKEMKVVYGAWGEEYDNERFINQFVVGHPQKKDLIALIEGTGVKVRHITWPPRSRIEHAVEIADKEVAVGAAVTQKAIKENGWGKKDVDLLIIAASAPPCEDFDERIAEKAELKGVPTKLYCLACDGVGAALLDVSKTEELKNKHVVITAVEGLSTGLNFESQKLKDIVANSIFGNGCSCLAFSPGKSIELLAGRTVIIPDRTVVKNVEGWGVIRMPNRYKPPWPEKELELPPWYELREGAEGVFAYGRKIVSMKMPGTEADFMEMYGRDTGVFFGNIVPPVTMVVLGEYYLGEYYQTYHQDIKFCLSHQPSKVVLNHTGKKLNRQLASKNYPEMAIPWVLDRVGKANTSADTILGALGQAEKDGLIPKNRAFNVTIFGAGASVTSMVVVFNPA